MPEQAKRLAPSQDTLRELFLKSGNLCAFPGCAHLMMDPEGRFIGQICHIEAAEEGGERFNPAQTNEQRRHIGNLMLMCYEHHVVTNEVVLYTVRKLKEIKAAHEAKFTDAARVIEKSIVDELARTIVRGGRTLHRLGQVLKWELNEAQHAELVAEFEEFAQTLQKVPRSTRQLLISLVNRATREGFEKPKVIFREIADACRLGDLELVEQVRILEKYGLAYGEYDDETATSQIILRCNEHDWYICEDLFEFSKATGVPLHELLVDLNFASLDG